MSKAEERAMKHCCAKCVHDKFGCSMRVLHNGRDCIKCGNYIKGYEQAEKDLELTWEDIRELYIIFAEVDTEIVLCKTDIKAETIGYYQEVLKRFNKERKEK